MNLKELRAMVREELKKVTEERVPSGQGLGPGYSKNIMNGLRYWSDMSVKGTEELRELLFDIPGRENKHPINKLEKQVNKLIFVLFATQVFDI